MGDFADDARQMEEDQQLEEQFDKMLKSKLRKGGKKMETLNVEKVGKSKFGYYVKSGDKFTSCTEAVAKFLGEKFVGEIQIEEYSENEKGKIIVRVKKAEARQSPLIEARENKQIEMLTSYAKDLFAIAYKNSLEQKAEFDAKKTALLCADTILSIRDRIVNPPKVNEEGLDQNGEY